MSSYLKYTLGVLAFKSVKGLVLRYLCDKFKTRAFFYDRNTSYEDNLNFPPYKSALWQCTLLYHATNLWNFLKCNLINSASLRIFKRKQNEFPFSNAF